MTKAKDAASGENEKRIMPVNEESEKSRTQLKKEAAALQKTGERLVSLADDQLNRMELPAALLEAIHAIRSMKSHGARRRQLQYIGSLMRQIDVTSIEQRLLEIEQGAHRQAQAFRCIESWRDRLVSGDDALMDELLEIFPEADRQRLGQLVRSARKEKQKNLAVRSARHLFRYLDGLSRSEGPEQ